MPEAPPHLDADIAAALEALGVEPTSATPVTGLPSEVSDRATFRIGLADGRTVKARRLTTVEKAKRYAGLVGLLAHVPVPAILVLHGRVVVEEWVEGRSLAGGPWSRALLSRAADVLGSIHATALPRRSSAGVSTRAFVARVRSQVDELVRAGALSQQEAMAVRRVLRRLAPAAAPTGLTHNDFCAENIVEDGRRRLHIVDNGGLRPGFLDFDLARTWYRWPMPAASWRIFLARYGSWRRPLPTPPENRFWRLAAVITSARFRVARRSAGVETPLRRMRALLVIGC